MYRFRVFGDNKATRVGTVVVVCPVLLGARARAAPTGRDW